MVEKCFTKAFKNPVLINAQSGRQNPVEYIKEDEKQMITQMDFHFSD